VGQQITRPGAGVLFQIAQHKDSERTGALAAAKPCPHGVSLNAATAREPAARPVAQGVGFIHEACSSPQTENIVADLPVSPTQDGACANGDQAATTGRDVCSRRMMRRIGGRAWSVNSDENGPDKRAPSPHLVKLETMRLGMYSGGIRCALAAKTQGGGDRPNDLA
jgi:hypothetical protein